MSILSHQVYKITNVETGTVLDLSRDDNRTVLGYGDNGGQNQRWVVAGEGVGRALHVQGSDIFLSVDGMSRSGANVVAMQQPFTWNIVPAGKDNSYRILSTNAPFVVGLLNPMPGVPAQLWPQSDRNDQCWRFEQV